MAAASDTDTDTDTGTKLEDYGIHPPEAALFSRWYRLDNNVRRLQSQLEHHRHHGGTGDRIRSFEAQISWLRRYKPQVSADQERRFAEAGARFTESRRRRRALCREARALAGMKEGIERSFLMLEDVDLGK